ncbi:hypothetical protein EMPG_16492 [Blastomyces silverae]|uniref:Uncharacterized protein n=1 Tax=Blastomyces silverae TaxID=2060906 RepID=A0A0H1B9K1_9EURO|nr:hypothetical protein EMPG_16492 [Blastomyces silverae]
MRPTAAPTRASIMTDATNTLTQLHQSNAPVWRLTMPPPTTTIMIRRILTTILPRTSTTRPSPSPSRHVQIES